MKKATIFLVLGIALILFLLGLLIPLLDNRTSEIIPEWETRLPGEPDWHATSFTNNDGDIYVLGYTSNSVEGGQELYFLRYNSDGRRIWDQIWGTPEFDRAYEITSYNDSLYIIGYTDQGSNIDLLLVKLNKDGIVEWTRTWDTTYREIGRGIAVYDDHIYVVGDINEHFRTYRGFILKYDLNGNLIWNQSWSDKDRNALREITVYDNNLYILGITRSFDFWGDYDVLLKYDTDGNFIWNRTWLVGDTTDRYSRGLIGYKDGIYVAGSTHLYDNSQVSLVKYDAMGNKLWERNWHGISNSRNYGHGLCPNDGNIYVIGSTTMETTQNTDVVLLRYDLEGNLLWSKTWGSNRGEGVIDILEFDENLYILGISYDDESSIERNFILKVSTFEIPQYIGPIIIIFAIILVIMVDTLLIRRKNKNLRDVKPSETMESEEKERSEKSKNEINGDNN